MADVEEPQLTTLAQRIAALNSQRNFTSEQKPKRPPPPRPATKPAPPPLPSRPSTGPSPPQSATKAPTRVPTQPPASTPTPPLPPRRPTLQPAPPTEPRRNSASSELSYNSTTSSLSANRTVSSSNTSFVSNDGQGSRKLPPAFNPASLPPLPPTKRESEANKAPQNGAKPKPTLGGRQVEPPPTPTPSLPPRLPSRPAKSPALPDQHSALKPTTPRRLPPPPEAFVKPPPRPISSNATNGRQPPPVPSTGRDDRNAPPPVPLSSRPSTSQIEAVAARSASTQAASCLVCRDFSGPDAVASQYPRESLPRDDPIGFLARVLCDPFPSLTDKARAIFTWFHHNVDYDYQNFCNGTVDRRAGPADIILKGLAVCAGYAQGYEAIAHRAGMECIVVGGHGKGFGYKPVKKGEAVPPKNVSGHAWNAVRIDGGEWKLLDACWGAGHVDKKENGYKRKFAPVQFTASNEVFGRRHYPRDEGHFFRKDQRVLSWEEYYRGDVPNDEPVVKYGKLEEEGFAGHSLAPAGLHIPVQSGDIIRFQVSKQCEHWSHERNGKGPPYLLLLSINGIDGRKDDRVPLETDGYWWWADVHARDLGAPGQTVSLVALTSFDNNDGRGVTKEEFLRLKGRVGMAWSGLAKWDLE
ncbi:related to protein disulfide-isomerase precursor [Cephalotrichum gorgonifer]|uniref:Related to protein disulfide-isomerase n=1 Tax=Cephalotrichum gorgonifer TaxID=2041049 RepID=A0AAE8N655_9PEZI|nr:related to protein disulfide-isomerase precursor [Cephalotrichum gorgonifer]